jgi:hypothetical protein
VCAISSTAPNGCWRCLAWLLLLDGRNHYWQWLLLTMSCWLMATSLSCSWRKATHTSL